MNGLKSIGRIASTALVVLAVVLAVALVGVRLLGFEVYTVLSGSMEPTYKTGSLIWVDKCEPEDVEVGDPITFVLNEDLDVATHRVIEVDAANQHFYTQGDANDAPDGSPVHFENLIGVPVFTVPCLGYFVSYIQSPPGCYVALIVAVAAFALMLIPDFFDRQEARKHEEAEGAAARERRAQRAGAPGGHDARRAQQRTAEQSGSRQLQIARGQAVPASAALGARTRNRQQPATGQVRAASADQANNPRLRQQAYASRRAALNDMSATNATRGGK